MSLSKLRGAGHTPGLVALLHFDVSWGWLAAGTYVQVVTRRTSIAIPHLTPIPVPA